MILMSSSIVLCDKNLILFNQKLLLKSFVSHGSSSNFVIQFGSKTRRLNGFISKAEKHSRKSSWWQNFFFKDDGNWLGLRDDDMAEAEAEAEAEGEGERTQELSEGDKFEAWKRRAEAIVELREAQEDRRNQDYRKWEDWLLDGDGDGNGEDNTSSWEQGMKDYRENVRADSGDVPVEKGFVESARYLIFGREDDDMLYEDRVFQYASSNSAKFLAVLIIVPWAMDFLVHDYILMPFLDRLDLREEWRLENRRAFANIWSDTVYGISLFILLYFNKSKVALLKFTGYKIINNISDTGKAFLIILITDIFLGYHSESGWQTLLEIIVEHYGLEVDQSAITIFICLVPVVIDACVKLWLFKFLPRLSPSVTNIFQEMKRH
ncbi:Chloroplast envelope membrane protein isoform C [Glycine soja]|uniref:Chloroplast envelope membrane protein isoform C n=1 Tax=Glycine soja TaxID=3848 RepID=A0A445JPZ2_GLYSO|nr:Chloroplast envelope membrane protein isoform C [Glycine soja]